MAQEETPELGEYARRGFRLEYLDDHIMALFHDDEELGAFSQMGATADSIQSGCARHLADKHGEERTQKIE
ncbi:MAG: hypothetical protein ACRKGH_09250 [Dehalogenimonas sp.]|uniref:Uncharacterized protein n=1 Tax=Candidatus Dehalogenimonas loeffleri TaxID=3127115 RepID=A0ABZ2J5K1_9CHLR|nr:hypothetical protein [Dehalogenimonas sp.]